MKIDTKLYIKLQSGTCTPEELEGLRQYFLQADCSVLDEELQQLWAEFKTQHITDHTAKSEVWNRLKHSIPSDPNEKVIPLRSTILRWTAVAAVIVLLVSASQFLLGPKYMTTDHVEKTNNTNLSMTITLDDGSTVWLKPNSLLVYNQAIGEKTRKVYLEGEARFDVTKDSLHPFIVETDALQTKVLGTVFNIKALPNQETTEILLFEGKVEVRLMGQEEEASALILQPGEKAHFRKSTRQLSKNQLVIKSESKWKEGVILFERADIDEVVTTLENWYDISIIIKNKARITETLVHRINTKEMSLEEVVNGINLVAKYQINKIADNEYVVTSKD